MLVQFLEGQDYLTQVDSCTVLGKSLLLQQMAPQIAAWAVVQDQKQLIGGLKCEIQRDYEGVLHVLTAHFARLVHILLGSD